MTVSAPAVRPRILAEIAGRPGLTAYELAAALGFGKPDSRRIAEIVQRLWSDGALVAGSAFRPALGREARIYYLAPPGTRPRLTVETPERAERRRASNRASKARARARAAGKPVKPRGTPHLMVPAAASIGRDSERTACRDADPDLFFGPGSEWPKARAARVARPGPTASPARSDWPASRWPGPTRRPTASGAPSISRPSASSAPRKRPGQLR